jgi:hypothetical protein
VKRERISWPGVGAGWLPLIKGAQHALYASPLPHGHDSGKITPEKTRQKMNLAHMLPNNIRQ